MSERRADGLVDVNANDVVALFVELLALVLLALAGFSAGGKAGWFLGILLPVAAAFVWALFAAPRALIQIPALRLATKLVVLGGGAAAGFVVLPLPWAALVAVVIAVNLLLMYLGPFARPR